MVGIPGNVWGEAVAAAVKTRPGEELTLEELREWVSERISKYKVPKLLQVVDEFPRNAMGKVMKPAVKGMFRQG